MRISEALIKQGVSEEWQFTVYGALRRDRKGKTTQEEHEKISRLCGEIGGKYSAGLYRFLTDNSVNHEYIRLWYGVPKRELFRMKRRFYIEWVRCGSSP